MEKQNVSAVEARKEVRGTVNEAREMQKSQSFLKRESEREASTEVYKHRVQEKHHSAS